MVPDYGYGVKTSYMLYLVFIFLLLSYRYYLIINMIKNMIVIINMIEKLELHLLMALTFNLGLPKLVCSKSVC